MKRFFPAIVFATVLVIACSDDGIYEPEPQPEPPPPEAQDASVDKDDVPVAQADASKPPIDGG